MHKGDTIPGIITTLFGLSVAIYTLTEDTMRYRAQSSDGVPGAGFFPVLLGFIVGILGILLTIRGLCQKGTVQYFELNADIKENLRALCLAVTGIAIFFLLWQTTKQFILCVPLLCFFLNRIFHRNWKYNLVYTAIFTAFLYLVFVKGFSVQFNM